MNDDRIRDLYLKGNVNWAVQTFPSFHPLETLHDRLNELSDRGRAITACRILGEWHEMSGRANQARASYERGMQLWAKQPTADFWWDYATLPPEFARFLMRLGMTEEAMSIRRELAELCESSLCYGNPGAAGVWLSHLGMDCRFEKSIEAAIGFYQRAVDLLRKHRGAKATTARIMEEFAEILGEAGEAEEARRVLADAKKLRSKPGGRKPVEKNKHK